jgi:hypothetical protein
MPSLDKRVTSLEKTVETHLIESGEIRGDLKWLKKAIYFVMGSPIAIEALHHIHTAVGK